MDRKKSIGNFEGTPVNSKFPKRALKKKNKKFNYSKLSIKSKLRTFKNKVNKDVSIKKMVLFGSRVSGKTGRDVDIDLIIVSPDFRKLDFFQRGAKMYNYWNLGYPVDFLCYTPEEFNKLKKQITIVKEATEEGVEI